MSLWACHHEWCAKVSLAGNQILLLFLQVWLLALLVYMARASAVMRLSIAAGCALLTAIALPPRLWKPQLRRLGLLALLLFVFTAIGSGITRHSLVSYHYAFSSTISLGI